MNTSALLDKWAEKTPDAPAFIDYLDRPLSFLETRDAVARGARFYRSHGIGRGDRVLILVPIGVPMYLTLLAVLRIGAVATVFDPSAGLKHIRRCCERARPKAMVGMRKAHLLRLISPEVRKIPLHFNFESDKWVPFSISMKNAGAGEPLGVENLPDDAPALMTFTSGSTGEPKTAVRSHGLLAAQGRAVAAAMELGPGEIVLTTLPVFTLANLAAGATTLLADANLAAVGRIDPLPVRRQISQHRPQSVVASPAFLERLISVPEQARTSLPPAEELLRPSETASEMRYLRRIYTGGAPVYPDLMARLQTSAPNAKVVAVYGSTEAEPVAEVAWSEISQEDRERMRNGGGLLTGRPVAEVELRVLPNRFGRPLGKMTLEAFAADCLPPETVGEIVVTGEHVLKGYLDGVGDETTKFTVGNVVWHRTGDAGKLDGEGRLWLLGRAEAAVRDTQGELYPFAVEVASREVRGVVRSALLQIGGKRVLALEGDADPTAVKETLAWAKLDEVRKVKIIPLDKRHNAKVDYPALRKQLGA